MNDNKFASLKKKYYARKHNQLVTNAVHFALWVHGDAFRKGTELPYILHPMEVASIAAGLVNDPRINIDGRLNVNHVIAAAVLHDTVEDTPVTRDTLVHRFGKQVADLVMGETENKREGQAPEDTWEIRKRETVRHLQETDNLAIKIIAFSDKLANLRSIDRDYALLGDVLWNRFNQKDPKKHGWYYTEVFHACPELKVSAAYQEYAYILRKDIFKLHQSEY